MCMMITKNKRRVNTVNLNNPLVCLSYRAHLDCVRVHPEVTRLVRIRKNSYGYTPQKIRNRICHDTFGIDLRFNEHLSRWLPPLGVRLHFLPVSPADRQVNLTNVTWRSTMATQIGDLESNYLLNGMPSLNFLTICSILNLCNILSKYNILPLYTILL